MQTPRTIAAIVLFFFAASTTCAADSLSESWKADFYKLKTPQQLVTELELIGLLNSEFNNKVILPPAGKDWITREQAIGLLPMLSNTTPCPHVLDVDSPETEWAPSTLGDEAARLIYGFLEGGYPISASVEVDKGKLRARLGEKAAVPPEDQKKEHPKYPFKVVHQFYLDKTPKGLLADLVVLNEWNPQTNGSFVLTPTRKWVTIDQALALVPLLDDPTPCLTPNRVSWSTTNGWGSTVGAEAYRLIEGCLQGQYPVFLPQFTFDRGKLLTRLEAAANAPDRHPNILFIAIDDMNDWTGFLGGHPQAHTPNMDALARRGVNFTNAHCITPACSPCRLALLYGVEPFHSGLYPFYNHNKIQPWITEHFTSLPKTLRDQGYETFGAGKIFHGSTHFDIDWSAYHKPKKKKLVYAPDKGYQIDNSNKMAFCPTTNPLPDHPDYQVADYGIDVLGREHGQPFFLAVGIVKPHLAFVCPQQFFDLIERPVQPPAILNRDLVDVPWVGRSMVNLGDDLRFRDDLAWERVRHAYLACIAWADFNIGRVLDALAASPYADNTVVVLWSDHGYHLGEKRSFRKFSLWEESTRVPLIIYDPRRHPSEPVDCVEPVSLIDLYRTVTELAGVDAPTYVDGESLVPQLDNPAITISEPAITTWGRGNYSLRDARYRYTRYFDGGEELYDHQTDPQEWNNLANDPDHQSIQQRLANYLPQSEAPLHRDGVALWNVIDADRPDKLDVFQQKTWPSFVKKLRPEIE